MDFAVIIPARHASTRLPGKILADIAGKPMVVHVADRARESGALEVVVATDHEDIAAAVRAHGHQALLTRVDHPSGTDRIAEAVTQRGYPVDRIVVNVQGDEPLIAPQLIRTVAQQLNDTPDAAIATACFPLTEASSFSDPNIVKVVLDARGYALYFSRATIPFARDDFMRSAQDSSRAHAFSRIPAGLPAYRHIGLYAYRVSFLRNYAQLSPAPIERFEALEQLRALWHGHRVSVAITHDAPHAGVDTAEDLQRVRALMARA